MVESLEKHQKKERKNRTKKAKFLINGMLALPEADENLEEGGKIYDGWSQPEGSTKQIE